MSWTITPDRDELDRVAAVLGPCPPSEPEGDGVWVRHQAGVRFWEAARWPLVWQVTTPSVALELAPRCLPGRLVWHAAELARLAASETVTISIPDDRAALVESDAGSAAIDLPAAGHRPTLPRFVTEQASATVRLGDLSRLLDQARLHPVGGDATRPSTTLAVDQGTLVASVDWSAHQGLRSTYRIPARATGQARCHLPTLDLVDLLRNLDGDEDVTIGFPSDPNTPLLVSTHSLRATVHRLEVGAARHHDDLGQHLADVTGAPCTALERGVFRIEHHEWPFIVELRDAPTETVCVTSTLARNVVESVHLWQELNALNARLIRARVWFHDGDVFGGLEVPYSGVDELGAALDSLCTQLDGFPEYLSGYVAGPDDDPDPDDPDDLDRA